MYENLQRQQDTLDDTNPAHFNGRKPKPCDRGFHEGIAGWSILEFKDHHSYLRDVVRADTVSRL